MQGDRCRSGSGEGVEPDGDGVVDLGSVGRRASGSEFVDQALAGEAESVVVAGLGERPLFGPVEIGAVSAVEQFEQLGVWVRGTGQLRG